jgi:hypothetical protein
MEYLNVEKIILKHLVNDNRTRLANPWLPMSVEAELSALPGLD